jgi:hypothetical protein
MKTANWKTLLVSVVCLMLLSTAMVQIVSAMSTKDTKILLWEDFESNRNVANVWSTTTGVGGGDGSGGVAPGGSWTVVTDGTGNHVFQAASTDWRGTAAFAGDTRWKDYMIEARTLLTDANYWGLIVRADQTGKTFYSVYLNTNGLHDTDGNPAVGLVTELWKHDNGIWKRNGIGGGGDPSITAANLGSWIDIKVEVTNTANGVEFNMFIKLDGPQYTYPSTPQMHALDDGTIAGSPKTSGRIGLINYDNPAPPKNAWFDDVIVTTSK